MVNFLGNIDLNSTKVRVIIGVVIILVVFLIWRRFRSEKLKPTSKKSTTKSTKSTKKSSKPIKSNKSEPEESFESDEETSVDPNVRADAQELFNLVHEGLAKGMQKTEFRAVVGDLADDYTFIELKQLYNDREKRNMDPLKTIDVTDYIKILQAESN